MTNREQLLDVPESLCFSNSDQSTRFDIKEVHSREEEEKIRNILSRWGYSVIASGGHSCLGFGLNLSDGYQKSNEDETAERSNSLNNYICNTKYNYIPLAKYAFGENQLCLSKAALCELKLIDESPHLDKTEKCLRFFERFGTHANKGSFTLGGLFCWNACSEGFQKHEFESVKEETLSRLHASDNFSCAEVRGEVSGEKKNVSANKNTSHTKKRNHSVQLSVSKIGGPAEADNIQDWKKGLIASNKTWAVIDKELSPIPVWDIVLQNHQKDFKDAVNLAKWMEKSYKTAKPSHLIESITREVEIKYLILDIGNWDISNAVSILANICKLKEYQCFIQNPNFRDFINKVFEEHSQKTNKNTEPIKYLLREILQNEIYEDYISKHSNLQEWLAPALPEPEEQIKLENIDAFLEFARNTLVNTKDDELFHKISIYLGKLRQSMIKEKMLEEFLLIVLISITFGYQHESKCFDHHLSKEEIKSLLNCLEKSFATYHSQKTKETEVRMAFILLQGLTNHVNSESNLSPKKKGQNWEYMKSHVEMPETPGLMLDFNADDPSFDWKQLELNLCAVFEGTFYSAMNQRSIETSILKEQLEKINNDSAPAKQELLVSLSLLRT